MTFVGPDKRQYVAVYAGVGGAAMVSASQAGFPPRGGILYISRSTASRRIRRPEC